MIRHQGGAARCSLLLAGGLALAIGFSTPGCSAFNPAAVKVLLPPDVAGSIGVGTLENAPGHVPVFFINNTRFNENLLQYMRDRGITIPFDPNLRPRVRFLVQAVFANGAQTTFEFLDGSPVFDGVVTFVDQNGIVRTANASPPPELTDDTLTNEILLCDVALVSGVNEITSTTSSVEVFVPTYRKEVASLVRPDGTTATVFSALFPPQFLPLLVDEVDESGAVTLQRNFGTREIPAPPTNLTCGSVVVIVLRGELNLPFIVDEQGANVPGYLDTDVISRAAIPGRFELSVTTR